MDPDPPKSAPRKVKFAPKAPPRRTPKPSGSTAAASADDDGDDNATLESLARRANEHLSGRRQKVERKAPAHVVFSHGSSSTLTRTFGKQKEKTEDISGKVDLEESPLDDKQNHIASGSTAGTARVCRTLSASTDALTVKKKKEYEEPWDYHHSYYPTTLPWRKPNSGDPEHLDEVEFGESLEYDENSIPAASDLGLLGQDGAPSMFFFQFPSNLPSGRGSTIAAASKSNEMADSIAMVSGISTSTKERELAGSSTSSASRHTSEAGCSLEELPEGYMGKMQIYKSGAVKLKLGNILYDVSPGVDSNFAERVMAINPSNKHCCDLGELSKHAVVTPELDSLLDGDLG